MSENHKKKKKPNGKRKRLTHRAFAWLIQIEFTSITKWIILYTLIAHLHLNLFQQCKNAFTFIIRGLLFWKNVALLLSKATFDKTQYNPLLLCTTLCKSLEPPIRSLYDILLLRHFLVIFLKQGILLHLSFSVHVLHLTVFRGMFFVF